jgi:hypothetical protein
LNGSRNEPLPAELTQGVLDFEVRASGWTTRCAERERARKAGPPAAAATAYESDHPEQVVPGHRALTDLGNAERFLEAHGEDFHWLPHLKSIFTWNGKRWFPDLSVLTNKARAAAPPASLDRSQMRSRGVRARRPFPACQSGVQRQSVGDQMLLQHGTHSAAPPSRGGCRWLPDRHVGGGLDPHR